MGPVNQDMVEQIGGIIRSMDGVPAAAKAEITGETNIVRDLRLDSLAVMDFIMALEAKFDTIIPIDAIAGVETVADLASMLGMRTAPASH